MSGSVHLQLVAFERLHAEADDGLEGRAAGTRNRAAELVDERGRKLGTLNRLPKKVPQAKISPSHEAFADFCVAGGGCAIGDLNDRAKLTANWRLFPNKLFLDNGLLVNKELERTGTAALWMKWLFLSLI